MNQEEKKLLNNKIFSARTKISKTAVYSESNAVSCEKDPLCSDLENPTDDLAEYIEHISRTTPTTMPEWVD